jgi:hypothetical protein
MPPEWSTEMSVGVGTLPTLCQTERLFKLRVIATCLAQEMPPRSVEPEIACPITLGTLRFRRRCTSGNILLGVLPVHTNFM